MHVELNVKKITVVAVVFVAGFMTDRYLAPLVDGSLRLSKEEVQILEENINKLVAENQKLTAMLKSIMSRIQQQPQSGLPAEDPAKGKYNV